MLIGTWADATWAIRFYERHGFESSVARKRTGSLTVFDLPERQIETSVVLADPNWWKLGNKEIAQETQ